MRHMKLNIRLVAVLAAVVVAVVAAGSLAPAPPQAYAVNITDPTGVFCGDLTVTIAGNPLEGIIMARIELDFDPDDLDPLDIAISAAIYVPESNATCQNQALELASAFEAQSAARPSITGTWDDGADTITGSTCSEDAEFGPVTFAGWTKFEVNFNLSKTGKTTAPAAFVIHLDQDPGGDPEGDPTTCTDPDPPATPTPAINVGIVGLFLDGPDAAKATFDSDWDKDGCLDWDELDPDPKLLPLDPFNPGDCDPGVGGIAELPDVAGTPLEAAGSSGTNVGLIAAYAAAAAAGALALGSAAAYARRRSVQ